MACQNGTSILWISLVLLVIRGNDGLVVPATTRPKIDRVSAGPIDISSLGCGTWSWGNRLLFDYDPSQDEGIYEAYKEIRDAGVTVFDTADSYGTFDLNGRAEILLGQFERRYQSETSKSPSEQNENWWNFATPKKQRRQNNAQQVATKLAPYPWRVTSQQVVGAAQESLKRLGQEKLAIAQLHWSTSKYQPLQEKALWKGIGDVYDSGLCEAVGVSNYGPLQLLKVSSYMNERDVPIAVAQIQYSLMTYKVAKEMNLTRIC